jgi:hypothetical protein
MKKFLTLTIALGLTGFLMTAGAPAQAAGAHKCKGGTSFGQMSFTFKKGRVRGGGFTLESNIQSDGGIQLSYQGESAFLGADGIVRGRGGAKTGKHTCDLAAARAALQK